MISFWLLLAVCFRLSTGGPVVSSASEDDTTTVTLTKTHLTSIVVTRNISATTTIPVTSSASPTITNTWTGKDYTDVADLLRCQAEHDVYRSKQNSWWSGQDLFPETSYMETTSIWLGNSSRPVSTLCDGWPRAPGSGLSYVSSMVTRKVYNPPSYTGPTPTCRYNYHGCELMVLSYLEEYSRVESISTATRPRSPACVMDMSQCLMPVGDFGCRLDAGHVRLLYWAQSKDPSALCVNNTHPVTSPPPTTEPVTAVYDGHTLTSPTVYLSFDHLEGNLCFSEYSNTIIGVPSNSISSIRFASKAYLSRTLSMNWADLEYPVPASAYTGMMDCWTSAWDGKHKDNCATSYDEDYLPHLALPTDGALYKGLDPAFANCSSVSWRKYVLDPPQSMKRADHL